jgi:DNA-binding NarL/FixJ family response regulator
MKPDSLLPGEGYVLLADADDDARAEVAAVLESAGFAVRQTPSGAEALRAAGDELPSLALLEIPLEDLSGYEVCRALKSDSGSTPVVFLSGARTEPHDRVAGLLVGADDYIVKPYAPDELLARLRRLIRPALPSLDGAAPLTKRELEILTLLAEGLTQDDIAARLVISSKTVGTHVEHIYRKLRVRSQAQAVAVAFRERIVAAP